MKTISKTIVTAVVLATIGGLPGIANADKGRGGGRTIDLNGRTSLLDLVDSSICFWRPGADVKDETPSFQAIIESLRETHWYLASLMEREIETLDFCFTKGRLRQIPLWDRYGVVVFENKGDQTGIRFNNLVYLQESAFEALKQEEKKPIGPGQPSHYRFGAGYFLVHEIMHSFIPFEAERRNNSVMSMTAMIARNHERRMTAKEFGLQIKRNQLEVPSDLAPLEPLRQAIEVAVNAKETERRRTRAAFGLMKVFEKNKGLIDLLSPGDRNLVTDLAKKEEVIRDEDYARALSSGTEAEALAAYKAGGRLSGRTNPRNDYRGDFLIPIERGFYTLVREIVRDLKAEGFRSEWRLFSPGPIALKSSGQDALALEMLDLVGMIDRDVVSTQLQEAIKIGWHEGIAAILKRVPHNVDYLVAYAIEQNQPETAFFLLSNYPVRDANFSIGTNSSLLMWLLQNELPEHLSAALRSKEFGFQHLDEKFFLEAAGRGDVEIFRKLSRFVLKFHDSSGAPSLEAALKLAIDRNHVEIVREILHHRGQYVNQGDWYRETIPASKAVAAGRIEILRLIMAHPDFDPNIGLHQCGHNDRAPLVTAAHWNYAAAIREILTFGDRISDNVLSCAQYHLQKKPGEGKRLIDLEIKRRQARVNAEEAARHRRMNGGSR